MPELPEVETVARQLAPLVSGRRVRAFEVYDPRLGIEHPGRMVGREIRDLRRVGKRLLMELGPPRGGRNPLWVAVHLRMTGRLLWADTPPEPAGPNPPPGPRRAVWWLDRGALLFHDTRRFGTIEFLEDPRAIEPEGLDPMSAEFGGAALRGLLRGVGAPIKPWLLRQDRLVGMGNIYACEALWGAQIHPERPGGTLTRAECDRLADATREVLEWSIEMGGTTFSAFQNAHGDTGRFQERLGVYGHAGDPCRRCGATVERIVQAQRSTFFCPNCQRRGAHRKRVTH